MNTTKEQLLQQLNTMQRENIIVLEERIEVISQHRKHLNETISNQAEQLQELYNRIEIDRITIQTQEKTIKLYINNQYEEFKKRIRLNNKSNE